MRLLEFNILCNGIEIHYINIIGITKRSWLVVLQRGLKMFAVLLFRVREFRVSYNFSSFYILLFCSFILVGCKTVPTKEDLKSSLSSVSSSVKKGASKGADSVKKGVAKLKVKGPSSKSKKDNNTILVVSKYPANEIPHTLLKKPVGEGVLTSGHGYRFSPTGIPIPKKHKGIDYAAPTGTPIYAAGSGEIVKHYKSTSYGNYIRIAHDNDFDTVYAHMDAFAEGMEVGSVVKKGQIIGTVGSTGRSSGPHLHHELLYRGRSIDPLFKYDHKSVKSTQE